MTDRATEAAPVRGSESSCESRLTDAYHRKLEMDSPDGMSFVLIFGDTAHQVNFRRGDPPALVASRLRELAGRLEG